MKLKGKKGYKPFVVYVSKGPDKNRKKSQLYEKDPAVARVLHAIIKFILNQHKNGGKK